MHDSPFLPAFAAYDVLLLILRIGILHSAVLCVLIIQFFSHVLSLVTSSLLFFCDQVPHKATKPQKASVQPATDDGRLHHFPRPTSTPFMPQPDPAGGGYAFA